GTPPGPGERSGRGLGGVHFRHATCARIRRRDDQRGVRGRHPATDHPAILVSGGRSRRIPASATDWGTGDQHPPAESPLWRRGRLHGRRLRALLRLLLLLLLRVVALAHVEYLGSGAGSPPLDATLAMRW